MEKEFKIWRANNLAKINFMFYAFGLQPEKYMLIKYDRETDSTTFIPASSKEAKRKSAAYKKMVSELNKDIGSRKATVKKEYKKFLKKFTGFFEKNNSKRIFDKVEKSEPNNNKTFINLA